MWRILALIESERERRLVAEALHSPDLEIVFAESVSALRRQAKNEPYHLLLVDDDLVGNQTRLLEQVSRNDQPLLLLVQSKSALARYSPAAERWTVIKKPYLPVTLANTIRALRRNEHLAQTIDYLRHTQPYIYDFSHLVAESSAMSAVLALVRKIAGSASSVLIQGETGTGKELIAAAVHFNSPRRRESFVAVNCAALHENLLESELFGHEKGAFTGAYKQRVGRFEQANGGTLFLDEIGDMSFATQAKVLRLIQTQEFERLGGTQTIRVDVRLIAATNKPLEEMIAHKLFREDLYYRLNVIPLRIPPLRERPEDILPLADFFLGRFRREFGREAIRFSPDTLALLRRYPWPGNVRELENVVERAVLISPGDQIQPGDLLLDRGRAAPPDFTAETLNLEELEKQALRRALEKAGGVQKDAARLLGISPRAIHYKIRKLRLNQPDDDR